jgi:hypothetical protein
MESNAGVGALISRVRPQFLHLFDRELAVLQVAHEAPRAAGDVADMKSSRAEAVR